MILQNEENNVELTEAEAVAEQAVVAPKKKRAKAKPKAEDVVIEEIKEDVEAKEFELLIANWKAQHKKIFKNEIDGEVIIWKRLKRGEYKAILAQEVEGDSKILTRQELMVQAAVLYPTDVDSLIDDNAGLATVLSEEILAKSGFALSYTEEL